MPSFLLLKCKIFGNLGTKHALLTKYTMIKDKQGNKRLLIPFVCTKVLLGALFFLTSLLYNVPKQSVKVVNVLAFTKPIYHVFQAL